MLKTLQVMSDTAGMYHLLVLDTEKRQDTSLYYRLLIVGATIFNKDLNLLLNPQFYMFSNYGLH